MLINCSHKNEFISIANTFVGWTFNYPILSFIIVSLPCICRCCKNNSQLVEWERCDRKRKHIVIRERFRHWKWNYERSAGHNGSNSHLCCHYDWVGIWWWCCVLSHCAFKKFFFVVFICSYILLGALLFDAWEGWGLLDSSYFCFISLSSIGLGDFSPAMAVSMHFLLIFWWVLWEILNFNFYLKKPFKKKFITKFYNFKEN